ncbi:winged helix-turn-helix transcriptional regulator [Planctomicrobium piriforme]|uniref:DNA-binding transcriptional regulator, HxlR family n=1 Tax=Planctomicrobium piriforme TaxID=1576369 RepID=A0A1I3RIC5_9PLAN|nr:helix-turn-helix domain-containing protein [Planctomicrobium piriforme]SFJ46028.1 DNA-binding transcriptional regulator, HxlR family [Planctomicrobium piriforme]
MQRKRVGDHECPVARCVDQIGDWWSILILRDALNGVTRFDAFQKSLGIAPTILTRRLKGLVEDGLLMKQRYSEHPPRDEYVLTQKGQDFQPVLFALLVWGNAHFAPEGASLVIMDTKAGTIADPVLVDVTTGRPITGPDFQLVCGPAASAALKQRMANAVKPSPAAKKKTRV